MKPSIVIGSGFGGLASAVRLRGPLTLVRPTIWGVLRRRDPTLHPFVLGPPEPGCPCPTA